MIRRTLISLAALSLLTVACGAPPDQVAETTAALNGHSSQDWTTTQPWLCYVGNPMTATWWPDGSYCTWQPDPNSDLLSYGVTRCTGHEPNATGQVVLYSGQNFTGQCAVVTNPNADKTVPYEFDSDLVQANGWQETYEGIYGVQSMKVSYSTNLDLCAGPLTGPAGAPCNRYHALGIGTQAQSVNYATIPDPSGGAPFQIAAFRITATHN